MFSGKKYKIVDSENEAKQNWYELNRASSIIKLLDDFLKIAGFLAISLEKFTN